MTAMRHSIPALLALCLFLTGVFAPPAGAAPAEPVEADRIVAVVSDEVITSYDLRARVDEAVAAYQAGDIVRLGKIMFASGLSSIQQWESGCPEMIALYEIMCETPGIYGGRFSGAGFKGCCVALGDPARRDEIIASVSAGYLEKFPRLEGEYSAHVCQSADGARRIEHRTAQA